MAQRVAQIIINNPSVALDKPFTYLIPDSLIEKVKVGIRVLVPFGKGNHKIEGYVIDVSEDKSYDNLKEIYEIVDENLYFNQNTLSLISLMRKKYMCTYLECLKCILPTGISIKSEKIIILSEGIDISSINGKLQKQIIDILIDNNNSLSFSKLIMQIENSSISSAINKLIDKGIVHIEYKLTSGLKDKTLKGAVLNISRDEAQLILDNTSIRNSAQKMVLSILMDNEFIAVLDLIRFADTSYSVINTMYKKGIIKYIEIQIDRDPYRDSEYQKSTALNLSLEQKHSYDQITNSINNHQSDSYLLHGITGSGKTEVYLQAIENVIDSDGQAIVLVPEISLTPLMVKNFKSRFGEKVAVIHSRLSLGERFDQWKKIRDGEVNVVVGARSAIFAPFDNLKLIIIDEEHEGSYKSENKPKYHAKEVALMRQEIEKCVVILGSATPSVDTYYEAQKGALKLIEMKNRVNESILPTVEVIDMRSELEEGNRSIFSAKLLQLIKNNIDNNEQTILFLNRRGYSTFVSCRSCGEAIKCPNCNITFTYHKYDNTLMCHYCGLQRRNPDKCPSCESKYIKYFGVGTQKIEQEINKLFPEASILRMDMDTTSTKFSHQEILERFENENVNILIGTQMIAKGLDFPNVTLVGVVSADTTLNIDDYRAQERTFQLLTQVAGRAGRGEKEGHVIIQTYEPENFSIVLAKNHDYNSFYQNEITVRKSLAYPPFVDLISIIISDSNDDYAKKIAYECARKIKNSFDTQKIKYLILKPTPAPISRIKQKYRWRILIKVQKGALVHDVLKEISNEYYDDIAINIDINSNNML